MLTTEKALLFVGYFFLALFVIVVVGLVANNSFDKRRNSNEERRKNCSERSSQPTDQALLEQYKMVYEAFLHHDRLIWEVPAVASTVNAGLLLVAFRLTENILERNIIIVIAAILTFGLLYATLKHRFFAGIEERTLEEIEQRLQLSSVQRTTYPREGREYWNARYPTFETALSAQEMLQIVLAVLIIVDIALLLA